MKPIRKRKCKAQIEIREAHSGAEEAQSGNRECAR